MLATAALLNARAAAMMSADGNWGGAVGQMITGPLLTFYLVHTLVYFAVRGVRGRDGVRAYTVSRLNWVAAAVALMGILGSVAQRAAQP